MFRARFAYATLKSHLEDSHEEQHWAKDTVARAFSARFEDKMSNLILIGPKGKVFSDNIKGRWL
jgi:hypothetical protein